MVFKSHTDLLRCKRRYSLSLTAKTPKEPKSVRLPQTVFHSIGYHYSLRRMGGLSLPSRKRVGAHARHYNAHSIGICYEGGLDEKGKPADTRTPAQKASLEDLLYSCPRLSRCEIGHRDFPGARAVLLDVGMAEEIDFISSRKSQKFVLFDYSC